MKFAVTSFLLSICVVPICGWTVVWQDEFDGDQLDEKKWEYKEGDGCQLGMCGWGNNELEWYQKENARVANGILTIEAKRQDVSGKQYTSARIDTNTKADWQFGKIEVRAKLPKAQGAWPAIWMLPSNDKNGQWPAGGEIDIMESTGQTANKIDMTIHYADANGHQSRTSAFTLPKGSFADDFHNFGIEWGEDFINWTIDDDIKFSIKKEDTNASPYPFNNNFYLILNVAVGGNYGKDPGPDDVFPSSMEVDWVRVSTN